VPPRESIFGSLKKIWAQADAIRRNAAKRGTHPADCGCPEHRLSYEPRTKQQVDIANRKPELAKPGDSQ